MILTDDNGRPFIKPAREDFPPGWKGTLAWLDAFNAWKDAVASYASKEFDAAYRRAMRGTSR